MTPTTPTGGTRPALPQPDGYVIIADGSAETGDLVWSLYRQTWIPVPRAFIGRKSMRFYGLARKQEDDNGHNNA